MLHKSLKYLLPVYLGAVGLGYAQEENHSEEIKNYKLGTIDIVGETNYNAMTIITLSGLEKGQYISLPGEALSNAIQKLWKLGVFEDINFYEKSIEGDTINLELKLKELPKINTVTIKGVKESQQEELLKELKFDEKSTKKIISQDLIKNTINYINNKYKKDGYFKIKTEINVVDSGNSKTKDLIININRGDRVGVSAINFKGNTLFSNRQLRMAMDKTNIQDIFNPIRIFYPSQYVEQDYKNDLDLIIDFYKENGYRDARIVDDKVIYDEKDNTVSIDITVEEGAKYTIGDIRFIGNTDFSDQKLRAIFGIKKGDVYNGTLLEKRIADNTNPDSFNLSNALQNEGYLWSRVIPVEKVNKNSIDLDIKVIEGPQARYNKITVSGNDRTHDYVVLREIYTRPGQLWKKADVIESIRRLGAIGIFDATKIIPGVQNLNPEAGTVDIDWKVEEQGQDRVEFQAGYGGGTLIGTFALSFNNVSLGNFFNKEEWWKPLFPMGDAQKISTRVQISSYFWTAGINFQEPWLGGKSRTQLFGNLSYSQQWMYNFSSYKVDKNQGLGIFTASLGLAKSLNVPDDKFVLSNSLSYQYYGLDNYGLQSLTFNNGSAKNLSYTIDLTRDNVGGIDPFIYPSSGSRFSITAKFSPPYSLLNGIDYANLGNEETYKKRTTTLTTNPQTGADIPIGTYIDANGMPVDNYKDAAVDQAKVDQKKFNWLEYYKINFKADWYVELAPKLVLRAVGQFGFLGNYNSDRGTIPFERYFLGGSGMMNYSLDGRETIPLRGYDDLSLTPGAGTKGVDYVSGGTVYNRFSLELRYPISLNSQFKAFVLGFVDAGATYDSFKNYNPFKLQRSTGLGLRVSMPMLGMLGIDFGYGFDNVPGTNRIGGWQTHFILGQQF